MQKAKEITDYNNVDIKLMVSQRFLQAVDRLMSNRSAGKITQQHVGEVTGISSSNINRLRNLSHNRFVTIENCVRMCDHFKVSPSWLLLGLGDMFANTELLNAYELLEKRVTVLEDRMMAVEAVNKIVNKPNKRK